MNEAQRAKLEDVAKSFAMGSYLSSEHPASDFDKLIAAMEDGDDATQDELCVSLWEPFEYDDPSVVASYILEMREALEPRLIDAFMSGVESIERVY